MITPSGYGKRTAVRCQRKGKRSKGSGDKSFRNWIAKRACLVCGLHGPEHDNGEHLVAPAHIKSRGAGGKDLGNLVPLCFPHHAIQHTVGWKEFAKRYCLIPSYWAKQYAQKWTEESR